jgi:hypothetical protein
MLVLLSGSLHTILGDRRMRRLFIIALTPVVLAACATPQFTAQTLEGARCKLDCANNSWGLFGGTSYGRCLDACMDLDRLYQARQATPK